MTASPANTHDPQAEQYVISAMLAHRDVRLEVLSTLKVQDFYSESHRRIFAAVSQAGEEAELLSGEVDVKELHLSREDTQKARGYIQSVPARSEWKHEAESIAKASLTRHYAIELERALGSIEEASPDAALGEHLEALERLLSGGTATGARRLGDASQEVLKRSQEVRDNRGIVGLRTGFGFIDQKLGGLQPGRNYVVGARAGTGKSTFVQTVALNVARQKGRVLVQSTEMSRADYLERMARAQAGIRDKDWETGDVAGFEKALSEVSGLDIHVDDFAGATPEMLRRNIVRLKPDLVIVDYLQRMSLAKDGKGRSEYEQVSLLSLEVDRLKTLYSVPLLTVVQLNRNAEHRAGNLPSMGDMRSSGQIEQDANVILLLHRPSQHSQDADPDLMQVFCPKNRHGEQDWPVSLTRTRGVGYLMERGHAA